MQSNQKKDKKRTFPLYKLCNTDYYVKYRDEGNDLKLKPENRMSTATEFYKMVRLIERATGTRLTRQELKELAEEKEQERRKKK